MSRTELPRRNMQAHILSATTTTLKRIGARMAILAIILQFVVVLAALTSPATLADRRIFFIARVNLVGAVTLLILTWGIGNYGIVRFLGWRNSLQYLRLAVTHSHWQVVVSIFSRLRQITPPAQSLGIYRLELAAWARRIAVLRQVLTAWHPYYAECVAGDQAAMAELDQVFAEIDAIAREIQEARVLLASGPTLTPADKIRAMFENLLEHQKRLKIPLPH